MVEADIRIFQQELLQHDGIVHHTGNGQRFRAVGIEIAYLLHAFFQGGQSMVHIVQEALTALIQSDLTPSAFKQRDSYLLLQPGQGSAQIGLGHKHGLGCF